MPGSYGGRFLRVNLTTGQLTPEPIPEDVMRDFVGGRALAMRYLYQELPPGVDPLSPENKLILAAGPLAGTTAQGFARWMAMTKSPLTGALGRAVGGADFAAWIKFAGFDFILIEGKAERPSYVYIENDKLEIRDASFLWGLNTEETQHRLQEIHGRHTRSAVIGPAGEKLVRFAAIASHRRTASRCGVGTVMGSKNLKAVAINPERSLRVAKPDLFRQLVRRQAEGLRDSESRKSSTAFGTTYAAERFDSMGVFPVRNFREGHLDGIEKLSAEEYTGIKTGNFGCYSCLVNCGQVHKITSGPYAGAESEGPEYESIWAFGGQVVNSDIASTVAADELCDLMGMDTISAGNVVGFAMELYERGILTKDDCGGLELTWGNHQAMLALLGKIAKREGIGDVLAEGVLRAARRIGKGAEYYAMHTKGMELAAYEPRAAKAHGLNYATSPLGGSHCYGYARQEIFGVPIPRPVDRFADDGKGDITYINQRDTALNELGILCSFARAGVMDPQFLGELLAAATGFDEFADVAYLEKVAERSLVLERSFIVREGFDRKDDTLPLRMLTEPLENAGPATGQVVRMQDALLDEYYDAMGCDRNGIPTPQRLAELELDFVLRDLAPVERERQA